MKYNLRVPAPKKKKGIPELVSKFKSLFKPITSRIAPQRINEENKYIKKQEKAALREQLKAERAALKEQKRAEREAKNLDRIAERLSKPGALDISPEDINEFDVWEEAEKQQRLDYKKQRKLEAEKSSFEYNLNKYNEAAADDSVALAQKLNDALNIATELQKNFPHGNGKYASLLEPLMDELDKMDLDYAYDVADYYREGDKNHLYEYVRFDFLPTDNERIKQLVNQILELDWSSYENYADKYLEIKQKIYESNTSELSDIDIDMISILESIMNTSAAWHIAAKNAPDSDQVKANWVELFNIASDAEKWGLSDKIVQLIRNEVSLEEIDKQIYDAIKEK